MKRPHSHAAALAACILLLSACGGADADVPTDQDYADVAKSLGSVMARDGQNGEVASMRDATSVSLGIVPLGFSVDASGAIGGNRLGVAYDYTVICKDASGATMSVCDGTTDSASVSVDWSGELAIPPTLSIDASRSGDWQLSHLQSGTAELDGDGRFDFDARFVSASESHEYRFHYAGRYRDVLVQRVPFAVVGGSVHFDVDASRRDTSADAGTVSSRFAIDADVTFHADGTATIVLDGTHAYDLDVATGNVTVHVAG